tara:strand:- start:32 stop:175 length:144 start_codon:yes stop_codon:yes gene_type:complete
MFIFFFQEINLEKLKLILIIIYSSPFKGKFTFITAGQIVTDLENQSS